MLKSIREDGSRLAEALASIAGELGEPPVGSPTAGASAPPVKNLTPVPHGGQRPRAWFEVEGFRLTPPQGQHTHFESTGDLIIQLAKGGAQATNTVDRAVLVLLDVDGEPFSVVRVQDSREGNLATVEQALTHLTTVRDELRRVQR